MANKKISELPYINGGKISGNTLVPLVTYFSATTGDTVHTYVSDLQTYFTSGLTGNTDVFVTGGTYSSGTITFTNNTGGTFNVTGVTFSGGSSVSGDFLPLSGGTVTGQTFFTSGLTITGDTIIIDSTGSATTLDTSTRELVDPSSIVSVDWGQRSMYDDLGTSALEWTSAKRRLNDSTSTLSVDWGLREAYDETGIEAFAWTTSKRKLLDTTSTDSVNWGDRLLIKSDGFTSFDWENGILTGQTNIQSSTISATTYQNLPIGFTGAYLPLSGGTVTGTTYFTNGVSANTVSATTINFNTGFTGSTLVGQMTWNGDFGVPQVGMIGGNVVQKMGENVFAYVKNVETSTLTKGEVVYIFGASGDKISVKRASNTGETTSSKTLGVVAESITAGGLGYVITQGTLDGLNLGSYTAGDILWLGSVPGQFTTVKQYAPYNLVFIGVVQRANAGNGQLYVLPQNGYELDELHNVAITGATIGDLLSYSASGSNNLWVSTKTLNGSYTITGNTNIGGGVTATTVSATTYQNLPDNVTGNYLPLSGGTVTGGTIFQSGLTANTIYISGSSIQSDTDTLTFNIQGTSIIDAGPGYGVNIYDSIGNTVFDSDTKKLISTTTANSVDWENRLLYKSDSTTVSFDWENGIITGQTNIESSTISATTYQNLPDNVTGLYLPLSGGTVSGNTTITANLTVSGNSGINWFSSNTSSDLVRITQTGVGNAFVVEDNTNPDSTPFIINSGGSVSVGTTSVFSVGGGGAETKLNVSTGSSGVATTGLSVSTPVIVESTVGTSIGLLNPDVANSQLYFGTPSDAFGAYLRWDYTNRNLILSTANGTGKLIFRTADSVESARIDQSGNMGIGLTGATQKLEVSGNTRIYGGISAQTATISGTGQNILTVIGSGNSTTSPLFSVQGSSGELFSINDSLVGSLFSVNDISGLPVVEVFSDNTTLWGSYQSPSLNTTTKVSLTAGTNTIYSIPTSAYTGAFYEYTLISTGTTGARAGQIMAIWSGTSANFTETTTTDIGTTTGVTFTVAVSGSNAVLSSSATTAGWTVKTIIRSI